MSKAYLLFSQQPMSSRTVWPARPRSGAVWGIWSWAGEHRCKPWTWAGPLTYKESSLIPALGLSPELLPEPSFGIIANMLRRNKLVNSSVFSSGFTSNSGYVSREKCCIYVELKPHVQQIPLLNSPKCQLKSWSPFSGCPNGSLWTWYILQKIWQCSLGHGGRSQY